jgi:hypothetical protein
MASLTQAMQTASENRDGARIAEISQSIHAGQKAIDRLFDALDQATREHEERVAGFDRELKEIDAAAAGLEGKATEN